MTKYKRRENTKYCVWGDWRILFEHHRSTKNFVGFIRDSEDCTIFWTKEINVFRIECSCNDEV